MAESEEELKGLQREEWKSWLKTQHSKNWHLCIRSYYFKKNRWGKSRNSDGFYFLGLQNHCDCSHEIKRCLLLGWKAMTNIDSVLKSRDITLPTKVRLVKAMAFSVVMYGCDSWTIKAECQKNWCLPTVVLDKTLERPLDSKEIKPVNPKGNQPWIFTERTDAEAPILWPPDTKSQLIGKDPDAGKNWRQEEKGTTEDEMVGWHHRLNGHWVWVGYRSWWWTGK